MKLAQVEVRGVMIDRAGQVWMLPLTHFTDPQRLCPCLVLRGEVVLLQTKMSEYRPEKRVPTPVLEVLNLLTGELDRWYEHRPLEEEYECWMVTP